MKFTPRLAKRTPETKHVVVGEYNDNDYAEEGILEYCFSLEDANNILKMMEQDSRYSNLAVCEI